MRSVCTIKNVALGSDSAEIVAFCEASEISLVVVGPEAPLEAGIAGASCA